MGRAPSGAILVPLVRNLFPIDSPKGPKLRTLPRDR
jgi:hypothetical protein